MDRLFDRELSWLEFNHRVLAEAMDPSNPPLERLKFIGIVSSNLDEFFMVRMASLRAEHKPMDAVRAKAHAQMRERNAYFLTTLLPELERAGLGRVRMETLNVTQREYLADYFHKQVYPVLTPIALDPGRPLPALSSLRLYLGVSLSGADGAADAPRVAVVEIPQKGFSA